MKSTDHHYEDGYVITNSVSSGWPMVFYNKVYKTSNNLPTEWNKCMKRGVKLVAIFVTSQWRCGILPDDAKQTLYGCEVVYKYSAN